MTGRGPITRGHWGSRLGFVLAAGGSAVGLGNIWKFPYLAGANGGGAFLLVYVALTFTIGLSVMLAELAIGRAAQRNPVGAYRALGGRGWPLAGYLGVAAGLMVLSFYSVIGGWTLAYAVNTARGVLVASDPLAFAGMFDEFTGAITQPAICHAIFMGLTAWIVANGIGGGIERCSRILMPLLFTLLIVLAVRSLFLPGAMEGLAFLFRPDISKLNGGVLIAALSQALFSLSVGMGAMMTYGSYLKRSENIPQAAVSVTLIDVCVAIIAGIIIMPAVFSFGFDPQAGSGLAFITLPAVFSVMPGGMIFGAMFFVLLSVAALTSAVSIFEVGVAYFVDEHRMKRRNVSIVLGGIIFILGTPASLGMGMWSGITLADMNILDATDYITSHLMLPVSGLLAVLFAGWVVWPRMVEEMSNAGHGGGWLITLWGLSCRYIAPAAIVVILIAGFA